MFDTGQWPYRGAGYYGLSDTQHDSLIKQRILDGQQEQAWYCDACEDFHDYVLRDGVILKACFGDPGSRYEPVTKEDTLSYSWHLGNLAKAICESNQLSPLRPATWPDGVHCLGDCSSFRAWVVETMHPDTVLELVPKLKKLSEGKALFLLTLAPLALDEGQLATIELAGCKVACLRDVLANGWLWPLRDGVDSARLVLDRRAKILEIEEVEIRLPQREFTTAVVIARAKNGLSIAAYDAEYHTVFKEIYNATVEGSPTIRQSVAQLNKMIKENTGKKIQVFKHDRRLDAYIVVSDYQPVNIK